MISFRLLGVEITKRAERDMTGKWMEECFPISMLSP